MTQPLCVASGAALQALSADEEVPEKEYEGSRRLRSSLNIKSKPKMKKQMGTYRRGRNLGRTPPVTNDAQLLSASSSNASALSDVPSQLSDESSGPSGSVSEAAAKNGAQRNQSPVRLAEGSVLAPAKSQQDRAESQQAQHESEVAGPSNDVGDPKGSTGDSSSLAVARGGVEGRGGTVPDAGNPLATRDAGEQAAVRVSEPQAAEPESKGLPLMW